MVKIAFSGSKDQWHSKKLTVATFLFLFLRCKQRIEKYHVLLIQQDDGVIKR